MILSEKRKITKIKETKGIWGYIQVQLEGIGICAWSKEEYTLNVFLQEHCSENLSELVGLIEDYVQDRISDYEMNNSEDI